MSNGQMSAEQMKAAAYEAIHRRGDEFVALSKEILNGPEPGYREHKAAALVAGRLRGLGISLEEGLAITGMKGMLEGGGGPGPTVAVIGELDSHIVRGHPFADPDTEAAHACGHHTQPGQLVAAAVGLQAAGVMDGLAGNVALIAVPAEEYIEIGFRNELRREGKLEFLVGKSEFVKLGKFDDVDIAMMTHTDSVGNDGGFNVGGTFNGMVAKLVQFHGVSAHAGSEPHAGVNALNAATLALSAIHAQRETFLNEDTIRVHPIITRGGGAVSAVPDDVRIETFIRGRTMDAVLSAAAKVDRSLRSGAMAMGASVTITTIPGYLPVRNDDAMQAIHTANVDGLIGRGRVNQRGHETGSSDMGDLAALMPVIHPFVAATSGRPHGVDYVVEDYETAVLTSAKAMVATVIDLLADGAQKGRKIVEDYEPDFTKEAYLAKLRSFAGEETFRE